MISKMHKVPFALYFISLALLIGAFVTPFVSIGFEPPVPSSVERAKDVVYMGSKTPFVGDAIQSFASQFFGEQLFSAECETRWKECFRDWLAEKGGFQVGDQYLPGMIAATFQAGDYFLGVLILAFSILFPLSKIVLGVFVSLGAGAKRAQERAYKALVATGKWSMTDVFVVSLLILFFKAEHIHLSFSAELGVYFFAVSTIGSSLASYFLGNALGARLVFDAERR